ncbi:lymphocyte cytosolic protein 2-like isoform X6 [Astatotilapia calliptera]|uniref:lymphocyte cytosolic protein 2-like isoform X6 n=1 Tax=Astatotilapia calliptera TaxID=8154 RepID=UPI000E3F9563|nr:lymphocyte cytosolic protein 2-like isoform X6 [Astatotilapia calliptera]
MSSDRVPSRSDMMGWNPQQLADYLRRMNLSGCDKVVLKHSISGSRFVNLSDNDLQKFPKLHTPMISKLNSEINKKEKRGGFFIKKTSKYQEPEINSEPQGWGEDEFDDEFDDDYESPYSDDDGSGGDYESPNDDQDADNHVSRGQPPAVSPRPPVSTPPSRMQPMDARRDPSPHCGPRPPGKLPPEPPQVFRHIKPGRGPGSNSSPIRGPNNTRDKPGGQPWRPPQEDPPTFTKPPLPSTNINRSNSSAHLSPSSRTERRPQLPDEVSNSNTFPLSKPLRPGPPGPPTGDKMTGSLPHKLQPPMPSGRQSVRPPPSAAGYTQELDPRWYVGKVTRGQAEGCLKRVRKDGAYLVRDSTRQQANQPFTLMVYYQDKVYNIQIRQQNQQFVLGTGLKVQESFPSVSDIISHYSQSPLLLIDAKNRSASQQNQCMLSDPAGYYMGGQNWS